MTYRHTHASVVDQPPANRWGLLVAETAGHAMTEEERRVRLIRAATDFISTLADPTQAWDIALADFDHERGRIVTS